MTARQLKRIFQKGECLSLETMRLYHDGKLSKKSVHEVEKHMIECGLCAAALEGLTPKRVIEVNRLAAHIERRLAVYMNTPPHVTFFRRFGFAMITGAMLLTSGSLYWYFSQQENKADLIATNVTVLPSEEPVVHQPLAENMQVVPDLPAENEMVAVPEQIKSVPEPTLQVNNEKKETAAEITEVEPLPAGTDQQEQEALAVAPELPGEPPAGSNTRAAVNNLPIRVKAVQVYPAVTHSDKKPKTTSKGGQLQRSTGSDASFKQDQMPTYPGGTEALRAYILANFKPTAADRSRIARYSTGVIFTVNARTGAVSNAQLTFHISPEVDAEILRIISTMPEWNPGKKRGEVDVMLGITLE
ncbi:MAG TPA: hypothetical protein VI731_05750 [Bacteroidia bacterium]|nr:hypothetical protein [Bacteroidia bacterium]